MDAHFTDYLAVVQAMLEIYGERPDSMPSEFHTEPEQVEMVEPATLEHEYLGV